MIKSLNFVVKFLHFFIVVTRGSAFQPLSISCFVSIIENLGGRHEDIVTQKSFNRAKFSD